MYTPVRCLLYNASSTPDIYLYDSSFTIKVIEKIDDLVTVLFFLLYFALSRLSTCQVHLRRHSGGRPASMHVGPSLSELRGWV